MLRRRFLPVLVTLAACQVSGGAPVPPQPSPRAGAPAQATDPGSVGTIAVLEITMPEPGTTVGEQFAGTQFPQRVGRLHMTESIARRWSAMARADAEAFLRARGYTVRSVAAPSSDAERADGVRFALSATVQRLALRTETRASAVRVDATALVSWELLDLAAGRAVFGRQSEGIARSADSLETATRDALRDALAGLVADPAFLAVLRRPRSSVAEATDLGEGHTRRLPGARDTVYLGPEDANVAPDEASRVRAAAGVVALHTRDGIVATGFLITRDGLAITRAAMARRGGGGLWARFPSGIRRHARIVRVHGRLALVQVACPDPCRTVEIGADTWPIDGVALLAIGAPIDDRDAVAVSHGVTNGGCGLFSGDLRFLEMAGGAPLPGEPLVRADDGTVVGVVTREGCAVSLAGALRTLRVVPEPGPR